MNPIELNAICLLALMVEDGGEQFPNLWLREKSGLSPRDIDDAVDYLGSIGAIEIIKALGTAPFHFYAVLMQSRGRYIYNELHKKEDRAQEKDRSRIVSTFNKQSQSENTINLNFKRLAAGHCVRYYWLRFGDF